MRTLFLVLGLFLSAPTWADQPLVFQSDFGVKDGAVAAMKGVAVGVSDDLSIHDLTHEIPTFNVWEAALRLDQTAAYWPPGTVFVSVVDPGVGTERKSVVLKTKSRHYFVTPDNGTLTFVAENLGIEGVREIDEAVNRRKDSEASYTFHGRDVYAYTGARLAAGTITFEEVGAALPASVVSIEYQKATIENGVLSGNIPILDVQFGNVWTNIDRDTFRRLELRHGDSARVVIRHGDEIVFDAALPYVATFGAVGLREPLI
jgi:S-adenosylmethionine hydrolase